MRGSSGGPVIVIEQSAEATMTLHRSATMGEAALRNDENVTDALVVSFPMIMDHKFSNGCPQRIFTEKDYSL
jgi:hypothetical protein